MSNKWLFVLLAWAGLSSLAVPAAAQEASPALRGRAEQVVALLRGGGDPADLFTPNFLSHVPAAQVRDIARQLASQYGAVRGLGRITAQAPQAATFDIEFERATAHVTMSIEPQPPGRITSLLFTGADMRGDSFDALIAELRALPGQTSVAVARLGEGAPALTATIEPDRPLAIGSAFKLWILAELGRQIGAGERRWSDVVTLDRRSMPGGTVFGWPRGAPVTLHTLATLMISQSDNSATDMLLHIAGRENVERMMATIGVRPDPRNRPLLSTLEMAALKTGPAAALNGWQQADEAGRRQMLATRYANVDAAGVDIARFTGNPLAIDSVEWFASAADMVRTMDWLRRNADETAKAILAVNPALSAQLRGELRYVGYKGGSEPGVINLTWLVQNRAGAWHVVTGSWNNVAAPVDEARLAGLMTRLIQLLR
jgi:beta-lactamase class A